MELRQFFNEVGSDYDAVLSRLINDKLILKFVKKFPSDPSFSRLTKAFEDSDVKAAFVAAHTLKGTAANLGLDLLSNEASELTEKLRNAQSLPASSELDALIHVYEKTLECIASLE